MTDWLFNSPLYPKCFFATPDYVFSSVGAKSTYETLPKEGPFPLIGGYDFHQQKRKDPLWDAFKQKEFIHPEEYRLSQRIKVAMPSMPPFSSRKDTPSKEEYERCFKNPIENLKKIVLGRRTALQFEKPLEPQDLLNYLLSLSSELYLFLYQVDEKTIFFGATPELLYKRRGSTFQTEALAGTIRADESLELLFNHQKQNEQTVVLQSMIEQLKPLTKSLKYDPAPCVKRSHHLLHLQTKIEGILKEEIDDEQLLKALHPTPAVAGFPILEAIERIYQLEPFERGRYAAPFGLFLDETADVVVGIRSALLLSSELYLFAGSGLVNGYNADNEWQELENKISPYIW